MRPRLLTEAHTGARGTGITESVVQRQSAARRIEVDDEETIAGAGARGIQRNPPARAVDRDPMRLLIVAERQCRDLAGMFGIGDVERDERVRVGYRLKPVVAGEHGHPAVLALESLHERRARLLAIDPVNEIEPAVERVDICALAIGKQQRLAGELVLVAAGLVGARYS